MAQCKRIVKINSWNLDSMSDKFIALRRQPRIKAAQRVQCTAAETRASLVAAVPAATMPERLANLGLTPVHPCEEAPGEPHSFEALPYLDAYVVKTNSTKLERSAKELLDPEYLIVPNLELLAPPTERGREYLRVPHARRTWPEISGIANAHSLGIKGRGVTVCILDTGVDADHRELRRKEIDFRYIPFDTVTGRMRACRGFDVDGHGTHVAGLIAGSQLGIAPDVDLMVAAVLESETLKTSLERVVVALDWLLSQFEDEANRNKPVIVNMSLGFSRRTLSKQEYQAVSLGMTTLINTLTNDFAVLPITAVGNDGPGQVRAPAYFANTLSVGAVDFDLKVAEFSGSGISPVTQEPEPNFMGFGVDVISSYERNRKNRSIYRALSGTSMATPYVTGIAALYACCGHVVQGAALADRLHQSALPLPDAPQGRTGAGLARFVKEVLP